MTTDMIYSRGERPKRIYFEFSGDKDKLLISPEDRDSYKAFKLWAYRNLPKHGMFWDRIGEVYVIKSLETVIDSRGRKKAVISQLKKAFEMVEGIPGDSEL